MHELYFSNSGEIDVRCITTMGVNVKQSGSIGYFGTGLKYAIAVLLREGQSIDIWSGSTCYSFWAEETWIKDKQFDIVQMSSSDGSVVSLGFTTDLGRNWTLEHAYREIYCNCKDEHGNPESAGVFHPLHSVHIDRIAISGRTCIRLVGEKIWQQHEARRILILDPGRKPIWASDSLEIYHGSSNRLYYRGIAAQDGDKRYKFTYNFVCDMQLSEDRELVSYYANSKLAAELLLCDDEAIVETAFEDKESLEASNTYLTWHSSPSATFLAVAERLMHRNPIDCPQYVSSLFRQYSPEPTKARQAAELTAAQTTMLAEAKLWLTRCGFSIAKHSVTVCADLGERVLGLAEDGKIFAAIAAFESIEALQLVLVEELLHVERNVPDGRQMQDTMLREILRLGNELIEQAPAQSEFNFPEHELREYGAYENPNNDLSSTGWLE